MRAAILEAISRHDLPTAAHLYLQLKQLDPQQGMPRQAQLDIANQLGAQQQYAQAAEAYETLLRIHPTFEQIEQIAVDDGGGNGGLQRSEGGGSTSRLSLYAVSHNLEGQRQGKRAVEIGGEL